MKQNPETSLALKIQQIENKESQTLNWDSLYVIRLDIHKAKRLFPKDDLAPFCDLAPFYDWAFESALNHTMIKLCKSLNQVVFGIRFSDEIVLVCDSKKEAIWCGGNIQKMISLISSQASVVVNQELLALHKVGAEFPNQPLLFHTKAFSIDKEDLPKYIGFRQAQHNKEFNFLIPSPMLAIRSTSGEWGAKNNSNLDLLKHLL